jgi:hypothetical protein
MILLSQPNLSTLPPLKFLQKDMGNTEGGAREPEQNQWVPRRSPGARTKVGSTRMQAPKVQGHRIDDSARHQTVGAERTAFQIGGHNSLLGRIQFRHAQRQVARINRARAQVVGHESEVRL